jgi:hypothetical protein
MNQFSEAWKRIEIGYTHPVLIAVGYRGTWVFNPFTREWVPVPFRVWKLRHDPNARQALRAMCHG